MVPLSIENIAPILDSMIVGGIISTDVYTYYSSAKISSIVGPAQQRETGKVLFWYDPIYPNTRFDKPGKSPFMDMDLIPKYVDEKTVNALSPGVRIDPTQTQNLGLKTEPACRGPLHHAQTSPASVSYNEYQFVIIQVRSVGFIEKVYPLTAGDKTEKDSPLIDLTAPDWIEAQSEYLLLRETGNSAIQAEGILERSCLAETSEADIQRLKSTRKTQTRFTLKALIDGVIAAFDLHTGMNTSKDNMVAKIQGMDPVQVSVSAPESIAWLIKDAPQFTITAPTQPDKLFAINKWSVLPSVDATMRTLQLRLRVDNPDETLKPGVNAYLQLKTQSEPMLLILSRALIDTGTEQRVIAVDNEDQSVPKQTTIFHEPQGLTAIRSGLAEGEKVVSSDLLLVDSKANISDALDRIYTQSSRV